MRALVKIFAILCLSVTTLSSCSQNDDVWGKYTSGPGGYSINMPVKNTKSDKTVVTPFGKQVVHFVTWKPTSFAIDKFKLIQVSYTDVPPRVATDSLLLNAMLDSSINLRKKDFTENDIQSEAIELNGYPGRSFIYDNNNNVAIVKQCIVNNKEYDLTVVVRKNYATNEEVNNFFNSFQSLR